MAAHLTPTGTASSIRRTDRSLDDVGLPAFRLAESVDPDGVREYWLANDRRIGDHDAGHGTVPGARASRPAPARMDRPRLAANHAR